MSRQGLMDDSGYYGFEECSDYDICCEKAYEQGGEDREKELQNAFNSLFGSEYSWTEIIDKAEKIKESKHE